MTVKQLIEELSRFPQDMKVNVLAEYDCGFAWAGDDVDEVAIMGETVTIISYERPL